MVRGIDVQLSISLQILQILFVVLHAWAQIVKIFEVYGLNF